MKSSLLLIAVSSQPTEVRFKQLKLLFSGANRFLGLQRLLADVDWDIWELALVGKNGRNVVGLAYEVECS